MHCEHLGVSSHMAGCVLTRTVAPLSSRTMTSTLQAAHQRTGCGKVNDQTRRRTSAGSTGMLPLPSVAALLNTWKWTMLPRTSRQSLFVCSDEKRIFCPAPRLGGDSVGHATCIEIEVSLVQRHLFPSLEAQLRQHGKLAGPLLHRKPVQWHRKLEETRV